MHGSGRGSKAFEGKLSKIEAVELKFTSTVQKIAPKYPKFTELCSTQSFSTSGSRVPAILG
jgi:hypothetical protein